MINANCCSNYVKEKSIITFDALSEVTDGKKATLSYDVDFVEIEYGERVVLLIPSIKGFEFIGWYDGEYQVTSNDTMFYDVTFSDDTTLFAKWVRTEYIFDVVE